MLLGLSSGRARIAIGGETIDVSRRQLERVWFGEYFVIWRAPTFIPGNLKVGDNGIAIDWLRDRLYERGLIDEVTFGPAQFDASMEDAVRRLQASHGLIPDGIVGPESLLALTAEEPGGPRLRRSLQ